MAIVEDIPHDPLPAPKPDESAALPDELSYLSSAFTPDQEPSERSKAYLVLASYCQGARSTLPPKGDGGADPGTERLARTFAPSVARIAEPGEPDILAGLSFLSALFQIDWQTAVALFTQESILTAVTDALDLYPSAAVSREIARLLSQASGHKSCRAVIPADCIEWLQNSMVRAKDPSLRASAAMAVVKLTRGAKSDSADVSQAQPVDSRGADQELVALMKSLVASEDRDSIADAVEGLAYLSVEPAVKEALVADAEFLTQLFTIAAPRKGSSITTPSHTVLYGILMIVHNLSAYRPRLSTEDAQIEKLRRMAKAGGGGSRNPADDGLDVLDDDEHVKRRGQAAVRYGALNVLTSAVRTSDSDGVRAAVSRSLLSLAEDKVNRGPMLQSGAARALTDIIRKSLSDSSTTTSGSSSESPEPEASLLIPIQALAKLAITASPLQVFGPNVGALIDSIRPFSTLLLHSSASLLQRFEATMALTNLSSYNAEAADRVAKTKGLIPKIEFLMLDDHVLIRRASTELLCNLMAGSDEIFDRYAGNSTSDSAKSRLHVLLALSDVDDLQTRMAASGAMATLTASPYACKHLCALEQEHHRVLRTFIQLIHPSILDTEEITPPSSADPGLVHRGAVCVRNFLVNLDVESLKILIHQDEVNSLVLALKVVLRGNSERTEVIRPTAEALKCLMDAGVDISV